MPFDASKPQIVKLDYDFRPYVNASGVTPEPTEDMIYEFQEATKNNAEILGRGDEVDLDDPKTVLKFLRSLTKEDKKKINEEVFKALAVLTRGRPSFEQMMELNSEAFRLGQAYQASIISDILNPKGANLDTNL